MDWLLTHLTAPWQSWVIAIAGALVAGLVRGFAGFGTGMIMMPTFSLAFNPLIALVMLEVNDLLAQVQILKDNWHSIRWSRVLWLALGCAVATPAGLYVLLITDPVLIKRAISIIVLCVVVIMAWGWRYKGNGSPVKDMGVGLVGGFMSGAVGMGGPPVILYSLSSSDAAEQARGRIIGYLAFTALISCVVYAFAGLFTFQSIFLALAVLPIYLVGSKVGQLIYPLASETIYRRLSLVILAVIAASTLYATFKDI